VPQVQQGAGRRKGGEQIIENVEDKEVTVTVA
jgi:hypothetical protein